MNWFINFTYLDSPQVDSKCFIVMGSNNRWALHFNILSWFRSDLNISVPLIPQADFLNYISPFPYFPVLKHRRINE